MTYNLVTFANQTGNIPLADLDRNFSLVSSYVDTAGTVTSNAQPNIASVGTLTSLTVSGSVTAVGIAGSSLNIIGNITGGNLQANGVIKSNGSVINGNIDVSAAVTAQGNITGQYILGNGYYLTGISSGNNNYSNANVASYLPTYNGNLTANNINITGRYFGNGAGILNLLGSEVKGTVANAAYATTAGTVTATSLPNLSTVGTLSSLTVNNGIIAGSIVLSGNVVGSYFIGDGSKLTNLPTGSNYTNANVAAYLPTYRGEFTGITINNSTYYGNGATLTSILKSDQTRTVYVSASAPTNLQGQPGDIWYQTY